MKLSELARILGAELHWPNGSQAEDPRIDGVGPIQDSGPGHVTFLTSPQYARYLSDTRASAVIVGSATADVAIPQLVHANPYWAFAKATQVFFEPRAARPGISQRADIAASASLGAEVSIYPFVCVDEGAKIGDRVVLYPGVFVGADAVIGDDSVIHANAVLESDSCLGERTIVHAGVVIGGDGFGFAPGPGGLAKIAQSGRVTVDDDVEIGANSNIDRGALADTSIGRGTKIDSQVQIGHNVVVGQHCMICGMTAIAGSGKLGNGVLVAGHSAVSNHCEVGDGAKVGGMTGISKNAPAGGEYLGFPSMPAAEWRREQARLRRLPKLERRVKELEKTIERLLGNQSSGT